MALGLLVLGTGVAFLWQVVRSTSRSAVQASLLQEAVVTGRQLVADLQETTAAGLTLLPDSGSSPFYVGIQPIAGVTGEAVTEYSTSRYLLYRWEPGSELLTRLEWQGPVPLPLVATDPVRITRAQADGAFGDPTPKRRRIRAVRDFDLVSLPYPEPNLALPLTLRLEVAQKAVAGRQPERFPFVQQLTLRNRK